MIHIEISEGFRNQIESRLLTYAAETTLQHQTSPGVDLTVVITTDEEVHQLNHQHRGIDAPTDVLSFEAGYPDPETETIYLGDVIIAYPQAESQAQKGGHPTEVELQLLVVHGVLHLLGHDHAEPEEKSKMWQAQGEILKKLGLDKLRLGV